MQTDTLSPTATFSKPAYERKLDELFSHYEEGKRIFIDAADWTHVPRVKPESENATIEVGGKRRPIPTHWLDVAETAFSILSHEKYGLKTYANEIRVIGPREMMSAYASVGMPNFYAHWSFGRELKKMEEQYNHGQMGLAYEIVINSDPSIAFCMRDNNKMMQMLVIAHACFGHNSFFANNHMFTQFTDPTQIIPQLRALQNYVHECEEKHGVYAVENLLDAAHALQNHGVNRTDKHNPLTPQEIEERRRRALRAFQENYDPVFEGTMPRSGDKPRDAFDVLAQQKYINLGGEENLLHVVATKAPDLQEWQRTLLLMVSGVAQYFYPQRQTQLMNEGWATFWHHTLMNDLHDYGAISGGMMLDFNISHTNVTAQPPFNSKYYSGINPYALGFAMYKDIQRICTDPTEEDRKYFPRIAGNQDWVGTLKHACQNFKDESFVMQYLSPKMARDFKLFSVEDDDRKDYMFVSAIHNERGFEEVRDALAAQYRLSEKEPQISAIGYFYRSDRTLLLEHVMQDGKPMHDANTGKVLQHLQSLWKFPVVLQSVTMDGELVNTYACPSKNAEIPNGSKVNKSFPKFVRTP